MKGQRELVLSQNEDFGEAMREDTVTKKAKQTEVQEVRKTERREQTEAQEVKEAERRGQTEAQEVRKAERREQTEAQEVKEVERRGRKKTKEKKRVWQTIRQWKWLLRVVSLLVLILGAYCLFRQLGLFGLKANVETTILTSSQLEDVLQIDDLSVCKITYNGVATVYQKKHPDKVAYYVSYEAEVKASINMEEITVTMVDAAVEGEAKQIIVTLPQIQVKQIQVDMASLDYMFVKKSANTEDVSEEAYAACLGDAGMECRGNEQLLMKARENCEDMIKALITPIIDNQEETYELVIQ